MSGMHREGCSGLWRSEDVVRLDVVLQREALHDSVLQIGLLGKAQFVDMNEASTAFTRPFMNEIRQCDDMQRKLNLIEQEYAKEPELLRRYSDSDPDMCATVPEMRRAMSTQDDMASVDEQIENTVTSLTAMDTSLRGLQSEMNYHRELALLARRLRHLTSGRVNTTAASTSLGAGHGGGTARDVAIMSQPDPSPATTTPLSPQPSPPPPPTQPPSSATLDSLAQVSSLLGVIAVGKAEAVHRLCYRITRGNAIVDLGNETEPLADPATGQPGVSKASFAILSSSPLMMARLRKLLVALDATLYGLDEVLTAQDVVDEVEESGLTAASWEAQSTPDEEEDDGNAVTAESSGGVQSAAAGQRRDVRRLRHAIQDVLRRRRALLQRWYKEHRIVKAFLRVEKCVLTTMNLCALSGSTCTASLWIARRHEVALRHALAEAVQSSGGAVQSIVMPHPSQRHPPTYFETNKFTRSFQAIVDSYGMARYKEVNPGVFTIVTFPYLFGIMYGDVGHAMLLLLVALYLIAHERRWHVQQLNEILAMLFNGRYLLLLMSIFALYMGLLYNEFFGFALGLFGSGYRWPSSAQGIVYPLLPDGRPSVKPPRVYAFGLDVAWTETENKLEYYNSVKMKHAVIVGVVQMFAGLVLSLMNSLHERNWYKVAFLFVPEFVFLLCTFGYMSILIVVKWCITWDDTHAAPSILEMMTNFFLQPGSVPQPLFRGQAGLQVALLVLAFAVVPVMLLGMPIVEYRAHRQRVRRRVQRESGFVEMTYHDTGGIPTRHEGLLHAMLHTEAGHTALAIVNEPAPGLNGQTITSATRAAGVTDAPHTAREAGDEARPAMPHAEHSCAPLARETRLGMTDDRAGMAAEDLGGDHVPAAPDSVVIAAEDKREEHEEDEELLLAFDLSEMIIHYVIHTIEYVLSSVSNTASYLRLWALSLAHAQLSEVFFTFAVVDVLSVDTSGALIALGVLAWLLATLGVLVGMEALSAFLHALRLHWVEFQNKFYLGDGRPLEPVSLLDLY